MGKSKGIAGDDQVITQKLAQVEEQIAQIFFGATIRRIWPEERSQRIARVHPPGHSQVVKERFRFARGKTRNGRAVELNLWRAE